jgi:glucose-1-phosphate thymidylyltransferase
LWLAREHLTGPMIMCFSDTLMETDFSFLAKEESDGVAWVMPVEDPRRFGVAEEGSDGWVIRFIEKPQSMDNNLVVVGCYYFKSAERLLAAIDDQMKRGVMLKNEYFLTDAISIMIEGGAKVRTQKISTWLDTGTIDATLDTNKILLEKIGSQVGKFEGSNVEIIEPVAIHESAVISNSKIGPFASIGANCKIENAQISESIVEADCEIKDAALTRSLVGKQAKIKGRGDGHVSQLNVGDTSSWSDLYRSWKQLSAVRIRNMRSVRFRWCGRDSATRSRKFFRAGADPLKKDFASRPWKVWRLN